MRVPLVLAFCVLSVASGVSGKVFTSPFPSTVKGLSIPNAHEIVKDRVWRGMAPLRRQQVRELAGLGVTDILVFRNQVAGEEGMLTPKQVKAADRRILRVHEIPFKWKDVAGFEESCRHVVRGLKLIDDVLKDGTRRLFFHCTVGEDRTGLLAGLYRIVFEDGDPERVFRDEMCAHGYAEGDPGKPAHVSETVRGNLTPVYLKMVALHKAGKITRTHLSEEACAGDPGPVDASTFRCGIR